MKLVAVISLALLGLAAAGPIPDELQGGNLRGMLYSYIE
jgi:hypothetical protein